jgi:hypothetical protein
MVSVALRAVRWQIVIDIADDSSTDPRCDDPCIAVRHRTSRSLQAVADHPSTPSADWRAASEGRWLVLQQHSPPALEEFGGRMRSTDERVQDQRAPSVWTVVLLRNLFGAA